MDAFLSIVGDAVARKINDERLSPVAAGEVRHWVVLQDADGIAITDKDEAGPAPHEILGSLIEKPGVKGAAYVTQHGGDSLVAQVYVRAPEYGVNSDIRRSRIRRLPEISVEAWEYTV